jgi:hypothetical protein
MSMPYIKNRTMTKINICCFMIKGITIEIWQKTLDNIYIIEKMTSNIQYIIISLKDHNKVIFGYIRYVDNTVTSETDIIKKLTGLCNIDIWEEVTIFQHLSLYEILIRAIVLHDAQTYYEDGHPPEALNYSTNLLPLINNNDIMNLFQKSKHLMALVIEETKSDPAIRYGKALEAKQKKMLTFTMENLVHTVHIIYPATNQCYHTFNFHRNPHYGVDVKHIPLIKWILTSSNISCKEYGNKTKYHHSDILTIHNDFLHGQFPLREIYSIVKDYKLRSRSLSNYFISYGFSSMFRAKNGEPLLTKAIETKSGNKTKLLPLILPILCQLSKDLKLHYNYIGSNMKRNGKYSLKMGSNFHYSLPNDNYYEGFDISIMYGDNFITPHCDVMNDWRYGYNYITVLKTSFFDSDIGKEITFSIICYTRKAIGDYLDRRR